MTDLSSEDTSLLALARDGHEPTDADRCRVRAGLVTRVGVGTGLAVTMMAAGGSAASAGAASTGLAGGIGTAITVAVAPATLAVVRVMSVVALSSVLGGGGLVAYRAVHDARSSTTTSAKARTKSMPPPPADVRARLADPGTREAVPPVAVTGPATNAQKILAPFSQRRPNSEPNPSGNPGNAARMDDGKREVPMLAKTSIERPLESVPTSTELRAEPLSLSTLQPETRLVRSGVAALHAGNPARALVLFDEYARLYLNGVLSEECSAERIVALCDLGRVVEARSAASDFLRSHPRSPLSGRVRTSCGVSSNP